MLHKMLTPKEVLVEIKVSSRTLRRWIQESRFPKPIRIGNARRWDERELEAYFAAARKSGAAK
ncbi:helix-turn-helix transcriptional regulator [Rhizobium leguminosarum]|uniref:helix-turn-helix transcriptional regulator n=1 Tax=Rhizobium leguminosarum TaxID=384 RepID=UPI001442618D|nr:helix-turn-helix domain-containing protein [Rhizobium leguminosarum]MBY5869330.1 helix-turn-helix domain-containing protein [Rhizobium leguminosarum]